LSIAAAAIIGIIKKTVPARSRSSELERGVASLFSIGGAVVELTTTQQQEARVPQEARKPQEVTLLL
jgi:hypothetical protein